MTTGMTANERIYLEAIGRRIDELRALLTERPAPGLDDSVSAWFGYLLAMKEIAGNASNDASFVAMLLAKAYLTSTLPMRQFDVAAKPQGAPGLDIDERTTDGRRVVAEMKTTVLYQGDRPGAQQHASLLKDFEKLRRAEADLKFMFVVNDAAFRWIRDTQAAFLPGVTIVQVVSGEAFSRS